MSFVVGRDAKPSSDFTGKDVIGREINVPGLIEAVEASSFALHWVVVLIKTCQHQESEGCKVHNLMNLACELRL